MLRRLLTGFASLVLVVQLGCYAVFAFGIVMRMGSLEARADAFDKLLTSDLRALPVLSLVGIAGWSLRRRGERALVLLRFVEGAPLLVAGVTTLLCAGLALQSVGALPLAMDEIAPLYQARIFAQGRLYAEVAPDAVKWLFFPNFTTGFFTVDRVLGHAVSFYWPGFALGMAPFEALGCGFLLNPILAGGSMLLMRAVALDISSGDREVAGTAMLLLLCAPAFTLNAATYYSMNAHLFANLAFAALLLRPTRRRLIAAGAVGGWALSLHNPFPHVVFALPWLLAQIASPERWKRLALLALGYVPPTLLLVVGWHFYRHGLLPPKQGVPGVSAQRMLAFGFEVPHLVTFEYRLLGLGKLMAWSSFGLLPLACFGAFRQRHHPHARLLVASALLSFFAYFVTPYSQGHGWGYRYFHPAFATLPLLGALALSSRDGSLDMPAKLANLWWMLGAFALGLPLRAQQVRSVMQDHYAQRNDTRQTDECVHFLKWNKGSFVHDLIWNDPWLRGRNVYLTSHGDAADAELMAGTLPAATVHKETLTDVTFCAPSVEPLRARLLNGASQ